MQSRKRAIAVSVAVLGAMMVGPVFSQERKMGLGESLLRAVLAPDTLKVASNEITVTGTFHYGNNMDDGLYMTIEPSESLLRSNPAFRGHESLLVTNLDSMSRMLNLAVPIAEPESEGQNYCSYYTGGLTVRISDIERRMVPIYGEEGNEERLFATVKSVASKNLTSKECSGGAASSVEETSAQIGELKQEALRADKRGDYTSGLQIWRPLAEQGDALAQFKVGLRYHEGQGVKQDHKQAATWYVKAAEQGEAWAQNSLGFLYDKGNGVKQDSTQAVYWFRKAAEQGHATAQTNLGYAYSHGRGVPQDRGKALAWYRKAAEQGHSGAQTNLTNLSRTIAAENKPAASQRQSSGGKSQRVSYASVFRTNPDGSVSPRTPVRFNGVSMSGNTKFTRGVRFNGIDFAAMKGKEIEIVRGVGYIDIKRFYP